jgi:hypothetical protein
MSDNVYNKRGDVIFTTSQCAKIIGEHFSSIKDKQKKGLLLPERINGKEWIPMSAIESYLLGKLKDAQNVVDVMTA